MWKSSLIALVTAAVTAAPVIAGAAKSVELLNVSYDPTRELLRDIGTAFSATYAKEKGVTVTVKQSHGGSGAQARAVVDGLEADVVTLALWPDTEAIRKAGLIDPGWEQRLPNHSVPWTSTIVFVVRKGNPKGIKDWPDIVKPGIEIVTPNPKTSGNGKFSFLAAWGSVIERGGSEQEAKDFVTKLYKQTPVLDSGARGSTTTFAQKKIGDVHLTWENEAYLELAEAGGELELIDPPISVLAEPPVAVVDANVKRHNTRDAAEAYLHFLYTPEAQEIIAKNYYRPINLDVLSRHTDTFKEIKRFPITVIAKDWNDAYSKFFSDGAIFDGIYKPAR
ncbi:MAG TPA: sulfate ABC transporter substrate-binding protein [Candidatus Kryptonia bacterium]|nr:sulfate ABC transporter substrate-binding protein [Candidatus Kryptonia bacterium]